MKLTKTIALLTLIITFMSCSNEHSVLEVTTFTLNSNKDVVAFNTLDAEVEAAFTSKQPGFINRKSTIDENGNYTVLVYWKSLEDAKASMDKFMTDASVADYAAMINASSMKMSRYVVDAKFNANTSDFVEVMSFNLKEGTNVTSFNTTNRQVETNFTSKKKGFLQRITGVSDTGEQIVVVYWDNKSNSDAVLQSFMEASIAKEFMGMMEQSSIKMRRAQTVSSLNGKKILMTNKDKVVALLNSFNTGNQKPISYINSEEYIQHNLSVGDGLAGFGEIMHQAPEGGFKATIIRAFEDGDYVFTHTKYDFFGPKAGFDVFRFENGLIVEHWDNLLEVQQPNPSGHTQFDGATEITDLEKTEVNKQLVKDFIEKVLIGHEMDKLTTYINPTKYIQHNPSVADGLEGFGAAMKYFADNGLVMEYTKLHKVLGEGNFVLTMSEGTFGKGEHTAYYDLFRIENGQIVEHWDVISPIPAKEEWKNTNGKF